MSGRLLFLIFDAVVFRCLLWKGRHISDLLVVDKLIKPWTCWFLISNKLSVMARKLPALFNKRQTLFLFFLFVIGSISSFLWGQDGTFFDIDLLDWIILGAYPCHSLRLSLDKSILPWNVSTLPDHIFIRCLLIFVFEVYHVLHECVQLILLLLHLHIWLIVRSTLVPLLLFLFVLIIHGWYLVRVEWFAGTNYLKSWDLLLFRFLLFFFIVFLAFLYLWESFLLILLLRGHGHLLLLLRSQVATLEAYLIISSDALLQWLSTIWVDSCYTYALSSIWLVDHFLGLDFKAIDCLWIWMVKHAILDQGGTSVLLLIISRLSTWCTYFFNLFLCLIKLLLLVKALYIKRFFMIANIDLLIYWVKLSDGYLLLFLWVTTQQLV